MQHPVSQSSDTIFMVAHAPPTSTPTFHPEPSPLYSHDEALGFPPEWITTLAGVGTVAALWLILVVIGWLMGLCRVRAPAQPPINRRSNLPNVPAVIAQANRRAIRRPSPPANPSVNPAVNLAVAFSRLWCLWTYYSEFHLQSTTCAVREYST